MVAGPDVAPVALGLQSLAYDILVQRSCSVVNKSGALE